MWLWPAAACLGGRMPAADGNLKPGNRRHPRSRCLVPCRGGSCRAITTAPLALVAKRVAEASFVASRDPEKSCDVQRPATAFQIVPAAAVAARSAGVPSARPSAHEHGFGLFDVGSAPKSVTLRLARQVNAARLRLLNRYP